tara:strand:+ start:686 stop:964 length:279 start_codon:yes stop_codon:yes gene_type:complete
MNNFYIKVTFLSIIIVIIFNLTIGPIIYKSIDPIIKISELATEKGQRVKIKDKILKEIENANSKKRYFTEKEAKIIGNFIKKISQELDLENQ